MSDPADALRDLAEASGSGSSPARPSGPLRPDSPISGPAPVPVYTDDSSSASASALAQLSGATSAAYDPAMSTASRRVRVPKPDTGMMQFRAAAVPVLFTVGLVMGVLGVWGVMIKMGNTDIPLGDRPGADQLAMVALVGLPLALCLFAGGVFFLLQVGRDKKKLAEYEAAKKASRQR